MTVVALLQEIGPGTGVQEAITHICRLIAQQQPAASGAGPGQPDMAGAASQGGDQAGPGGSGSSTDEAGEELAAGAGPTARQHSMPLGRTATTESERGLLLSPMDPSAVLRSYALRWAWQLGLPCMGATKVLGGAEF